MDSIDKLRDWSHRYDNGWIQDDGSILLTTDTHGVYYGENYGESIRSMIDEIEAEIQRDYMELPKDADDVPIRVGDVMQFRNDAPVRVDSIGNSRCYVGDFGWFGGNGGFYGKGTLKNCRHYHAPTVEDVLLEMCNEVWEASGTCQTTWSDSGLDGIEERYADKLREVLRDE